MRRVVSIILIAVVMVCHGLVASHAHSVIALGHAASHSSSPHFHFHGAPGHGAPGHGAPGHGAHSHASRHVGGDHHHGHKHSSVPFDTLSEEPPVTDSNPFYCAEPVLSVTQRFCDGELLLQVLSQPFVFEADGLIVSMSFAPEIRRDSSFQWSIARTPLYLLDLSIRC